MRIFRFGIVMMVLAAVFVAFLWMRLTTAQESSLRIVQPVPKLQQVSNYTVPTQDAEGTRLVHRYDELERKVMDLSKRREQAESPGDRAKLRAQIEDLTGQQFDLRVQARESEIARLERRLADVEATVQQQKALREKIIEKRVQDLLVENNDLRWEPLSRSRTLFPATRPRPSRRVTLPRGQNQYSVTPRATRRTAGSPSVDHQLELSILPESSANAVAEAEARLKYEAQDYERLKRLYKAGTITASDHSQARRDTELAQLAVDREKQRFAARKRLLELDVEKAALALKEAQVRLTGSNQARHGETATDAEVELGRVGVDKAKVAVERAKTLLELHTETPTPEQKEQQQ